jgi:Holliday junction resolvase RusA-like endonuclease
MMVEFTVPGIPQGKGRPRVGRIGNVARMFTPSKTVAYEGLVAHSAQEAMAGQGPLQGACCVHLHITVPVPASWSKRKQTEALAGRVYPTTKPDKDNIIKAVYDGMNGVVWRDDVQAVEGTQIKRYGSVPGVRVRVSEMGTE